MSSFPQTSSESRSQCHGRGPQPWEGGRRVTDLLKYDTQVLEDFRRHRRIDVGRVKELKEDVARLSSALVSGGGRR